MKFFNLRRPKGQNGNDLMESSDASLSNLEKEPRGDAPYPIASTTHAGNGEKKIVEATPLEDAAALDKLSDEPEYPTGLKLFVITIALCLSVFLVALVSYHVYHIVLVIARYWLLADPLWLCRTTPSLRRQSQK